MREHKSISIADQIFEQLEHDILTEKYKRGDMLTEQKLSETLGVSRTPVREALRRLEQEHIVHETSRGTVVIGITQNDLRDMYEIRMHVEGLAAARAAANISDEGLAKMKDILELQRYYVEKTKSDGSDNSENIKDLDSDFHRLLYLYSGSKAYLETLLPLHKKMIKYRKAAVRHGGRALCSLEEHEGIYRALAAHDSELASKLATEHVRRAGDSILSKNTEILKWD